MSAIVYRTPEFRRIAELARRDPSTNMTETMRDAVTAALRCHGGTMRANAIQAAGWIEAAQNRGGLFAAGVGSGKTLLSFGMPTVLSALRAIHIVPGGLVAKTDRDFAELRGHWKETPMQIVSYQRLGRANGSQILELYQPDLLVLDEAHAARNIGEDGAACARVIEAYMLAHPETMVVVMSGTITSGSLKDYAHLACWALGSAKTFLPTNYIDLEQWRCAVDAEVEAGKRIGPGALLDFATDEDKGTQLQRARAGVARRMRETPGVLRTTETGVDASLYVSVIEVASGIRREDWDTLRTPPSKEESAPPGWTLPNGEEMWDGLEVHRQARNFGNGYFTYWDPPPPPTWRERRRRWAKCARWLIKHGRCNTEVEARTAAETEGEIAFTNPDGSREHVDPVAARDDWLEIRETYDPTKHVKVEWLTTTTLDACVAWARRVKRGIIWTQHIPVGERLEKDYGITYYRQKGLSAKGVYIEDAPEKVIVASLRANAVGRNLQKKWSSNLLVSPFGSAEWAEQLIGRTHRTGQTADVVTVDALLVCGEHVSALKRARLRASAISQLTSTPQRLCFCDWNVDLKPFASRAESRWVSKGIDESDETDAVELASTDYGDVE